MQKENAPVWFITGCSTGFGRELATLILSKGWKAVITARDAGKIKDIAEGHEASALVLELDVTDKTIYKQPLPKHRILLGK